MKAIVTGLLAMTLLGGCFFGPKMPSPSDYAKEQPKSSAKSSASTSGRDAARDSAYDYGRSSASPYPEAYCRYRCDTCKGGRHHDCTLPYECRP